MSKNLHRLKAILERERQRPLVVLTGAGLSAASGIPTFRGDEGYWRSGSANYHPQELATRQAFQRMPETVWAWYIYRKSVCNRAEPNAGHLILADWDRRFADRFLLITQNVDGLHLRAGHHRARTYQVHGNIDYMRCWQDCSADLTPIPSQVGTVAQGERLSENQMEALRCPRCGAQARPHVLWFDECYDEARFRFNSSLQASRRCAALLTVGSSGTTNLPMQVAQNALSNGALLIDINPEQNPFARLAQAAGGISIRADSDSGLEELRAALL